MSTQMASIRLGAILILSMSVLACGTTAGGTARPVGGSDGTSVFRAAPIEDSPEAAAYELGRGQRSYAAPVEGSPEQAAVDLGR